MQIEQARNRRWANVRGVLLYVMIPGPLRHELGGAVDGTVLADDFHLEDLVSVFGTCYFGVG